MLLVPCCDVRYDFRIKTMFGSSLTPVVSKKWGLMSYLRWLCLFVYSNVQHILCCVFVLFVFVLCTICCQFLRIVNFWMLHFILNQTVIANIMFHYLHASRKHLRILSEKKWFNNRKCENWKCNEYLIPLSYSFIWINIVFEVPDISATLIVYCCRFLPFAPHEPGTSKAWSWHQQK